MNQLRHQLGTYQLTKVHEELQRNWRKALKNQRRRKSLKNRAIFQLAEISQVEIPTCKNRVQLAKSSKLKFTSPLFNLQKISQPAKAPPITRVPFRKFNFKFRSLRIKLRKGATCKPTCEFRPICKNANRRLNSYLNL